MITLIVALRKESVDRNCMVVIGALCVLPSLSARRAWIEIRDPPCYSYFVRSSLSARRAWIEIDIPPNLDADHASLSARRAWIEILNAETLSALACSSLSARRAWIEIDDMSGETGRIFVALRKESVDRNLLRGQGRRLGAWSLSARRAWIEIHHPKSKHLRLAGRSPQGERG